MMIRSFYIGLMIWAGITGCRPVSGQTAEEVKRETLARHETRARFMGIDDHVCRGLTSLCPDRCGHSGSLARFDIIEYVGFESFSEYGKKQESYSVLIENNMGKVLVSQEIHSAISKLVAGDEVCLDWNHDYVTRNGASGPERPIVRLEPVPASGALPQREPLWLEGAPEAKGNDPAKDQPAITIHMPEANCGTAVIICPGGGYGNLALGHEGRDIAEWFNSMGIVAAVLEYRMSRGGYRHPVPLMDAQRAMRTVRSRARELGVDPSHIGIMGFSAGGHLASTLGTHFDRGNPDAADPIERVGCRPDFMILCYPVIAFGEPFTHKGSQNNLIGKHPEEELVRSLSSEKQVTGDTPPAFLFHTEEDTAVPLQNSAVFYEALRQAGVPAMLKVYPKGRHGLGLARQVEGTREWPDECAKWLREMEFLPPAD
jgi:acetyl esterase/lipase